MENDTPNFAVSTLDSVIGDSFDSSESTLSNNLTEEPKVIETAPQVQQAEPEETEVKVEKPDVVEERFTDRVNPDDLDEKELAVYKSLQSDYTKKRQLESQKVRDLEAKLKELESAKSQPTNDEVNNDPYVSDEERIRNLIRVERESEWEKQATKEVEILDGRLNENHPDYDPIFDDYARDKLETALNEYIGKEGTKIGFDYKSQLSEISEKWNGYLDKHTKSFINKQNDMINKKTEAIKKSSPETKQAPVNASGRMSISDAIDNAFSK